MSRDRKSERTLTDPPPTYRETSADAWSALLADRGVVAMRRVDYLSDASTWGMKHNSKKHAQTTFPFASERSTEDP